jgi:hypothetical protein
MQKETGKTLEERKEALSHLSYRIKIKLDIVEQLAIKIKKLGRQLDIERNELGRLEKERNKELRDNNKLQKQINKEKAGKVIPTFV